MSDYFIKSENLVYRYVGREEEAEHEAAEALKSIDISIKKGEFIAILGRNGSGKSTFARHLNALLAPSSGTLWVKGLDSKNPENTWDIRKSVGMVFQNPDSQLIATIVEDDIAFGPENLGVPSSDIRLRVNEALAAVQMADHAKSAPQFLSGGQKQRVAIAGVLAMRPDCIVLDEPTSMLDPLGRREVLDTVFKLNRESSITIILITHYMEEAVIADRIVVMDEGCIMMDGAPREIFSNAPKVRSYGLDVPQATALYYKLVDMGLPPCEIPLTPEEFMECPFVKEIY